MRRSAGQFDEGDESEAALLATHIRVLVHDPADASRSRSRSLLTQLGLKHQIGYVDTTIRRPELPPGYNELPPGTITLHSGIVITHMGPGGVRFRAPLGDLAPERLGARPHARGGRAGPRHRREGPSCHAQDAAALRLQIESRRPSRVARGGRTDAQVRAV